LLCDLHVHSRFSDGTDTPTQLISQAQRLGISALALCDHNTLAGLPEFLSAAADTTIEAIPGIEFSTTFRDLELHILALKLPLSAYEPIQAQLADGLRKKEAANRDLILRLQARNIPIQFEEIKAKSPTGYINRAHIAVELMRLGYTTSVKEAFSTLLSAKHGLYHPPAWPEAIGIIESIHRWGAIPVLAHPLLSMDTSTCEDFLRLAVPAGLIGMETLYSRYTEEMTRAADTLAQKYGIVPSGGSDYHGANKPDVRMGQTAGNEHIPIAVWQQLQIAAVAQNDR
jgi:predicted metal-dependent phosphoesterase TrpH